MRSGVGMLAASAASGVLAIVLLFAGATWWMPPELSGPIGEGGWTARSAAWFSAEGFFPPEHNGVRSFSWTGSRSVLRMAHLERSRPYELTLELSAGRPAEALPPPTLAVFVDGVRTATIETSNERQRVTVPIRPRRAHGSVVILQVSDTFVPGPHDRRALGVMLELVNLVPGEGRFRPSGSAAMRAGLAVAAIVLGLLLSGVSHRLAAMVAAGVAVGMAWLLLLDGAFIGTFVDSLVDVGLGAGLLGAVAGLLGWRWPSIAGLPEWSVAAGILIAAGAFKLALIAHPLMTVGDAIFQVHRAEWVHSGRYFFTSVTPRPFYEIPYPIALYVAALPFWDYFPTKLDIARLLRTLTLVADGLVGLALYAAARRQWNDRRVALVCAGLWPFARAPFQALCNANLTNLFGQSLFSAALLGAAWIAAGTRRSPGALAVTWGLLALAFLSHFGTVLVGLPLVATVAAMLVVAGRSHERRVGIWLAAITLAALAISYVAYYSHFVPTYRQTMARVLSDDRDVQPGSTIAAPPSVKFWHWINDLSDDYGQPGLALALAAVAGFALLAGGRRREGLTIVLAGWGLVWVALTALGILTAVQVRVNLAAAPLFVCLAAYAIGRLAATSRLGAALATAVALAVAWSGIRLWLTCLGCS